MSDVTMTIDGRAVAGQEHFGVVNPATGKVFAQARECSRDELDIAMEAPSRAFLTWRADEGRRRQSLEACAEALKDRASDLTEILTREQGKPLARATLGLAFRGAVSRCC